MSNYNLYYPLNQTPGTQDCKDICHVDATIHHPHQLWVWRLISSAAVSHTSRHTLALNFHWKKINHLTKVMPLPRVAHIQWLLTSGIQRLIHLLLPTWDNSSSGASLGVSWDLNWDFPAAHLLLVSNPTYSPSFTHVVFPKAVPGKLMHAYFYFRVSSWRAQPVPAAQTVSRARAGAWMHSPRHRG